MRCVIAVRGITPVLRCLEAKFYGVGLGPMTLALASKVQAWALALALKVEALALRF